MSRLIVMVTLFAFVLGTGVAVADEKVLATQKGKDVVVTLKSEAGQWKRGKNDFVIEFTSAKDKAPVDAGKVTLNTSMTMSGMPPMIAGATLAPDQTPGRYKGTIEFPDAGTRQVTVTWAGAAGKGSTKFSIPVR